MNEHPLGSYNQQNLGSVASAVTTGAFGLVKMAIMAAGIWYLFFKENAKHKIVYMKADEYDAYKKYFKRN